MSLKNFLFPARASTPLTMVSAFVAAMGIYNGAQALAQEQPARAAANCLFAAAAATISSRNRSVWVLRDKNETLQNELMRTHSELMAYKLAAQFSQGSSFYQEEGGDIVDGDLVREVPESVEHLRLPASPK